MLNARASDASERAFPRLMIAPTVLVMAALTAYPLIFTLIYSFTDYQYLKGTDAAQFVGFKNYLMLFRNNYFRQAVLNTVKFTILAVIFEMVIGLLIAVLVGLLIYFAFIAATKAFTPAEYERLPFGTRIQEFLHHSGM